MNIHCDIDGTLTKDGTVKWGEPREENIDAIRAAAANGHTVVLWSASGERYANDFNRQYRIGAFVCLAKPDVCFDDHHDIRPDGMMEILPPDRMASWVSSHGVPKEEK